MNNEINKDAINDMLDSMSGQLGGNSGKLKDAVNNGSFDKVLNNLKPADAQKLQSLLSNKEETERLLQTPQAQMLLKKLLK